MPHTIAENLTRLSNAKDAIAAAIVDKGGTIEAGDGFESFADKIEAISGGGGVLISKNITENGTYYAVDDEADGYSSVTVNIQQLPINFLKYIKSEGNSVIVTDILPDYDWEVFIDLKAENLTTSGAYEVFGINRANEHFLMSIPYYGGSTCEFQSWSGFTPTGGDSISVSGLSIADEVGQRNTMIARRGNGNCIYGKHDFTMTSRTTDDTPSAPIIISGVDENGTIYPYSRGELTIYGIKICLSGALVHNLVPAQAKAGGRAGLYDIITGIFYPSDSNYDDFIKGT